MSWNTFWTDLVQIIIALYLLSVPTAVFVWIVLGAVTSRLAGYHNSRVLGKKAAGE
jgi:hypothetical protein